MKHESQVLTIVISTILSYPVVTNSADLNWPYNQPTPIIFSLNDIETAYQAWKSEMILNDNAGGNGRYRVRFESNAGQSVSEGIAYGMMLTSLFDDQTEFDGLWLFAKDHFNKNGVMHWKIGSPGELLGEGGATDAEVDMGIALINACAKQTSASWPESPLGIDYCNDAYTLIETIYDYEVDKPGPEPYAGQEDNLGNELLPGDGWYTVDTYPDGIVNLSYFAPGFFRVFGAFTGQPAKWQQVIDRNYAIADLAQAKPGNCSKLISNWNTYQGDPQVVDWQGDSSRYWGWDAARFAWRVAVDATWFGDAKAIETSNELASFFASVGMSNIGVEYSLDGRRHHSWNHMFFDANAASSIFAATALTPVNCGDAKGSIVSDAQEGYDVLNQHGPHGGYYGGYWRLMGMLLMTGNFPNLYALANDTQPLTLALTKPLENATFAAGSAIEFAAQTNQDNQINQVTFFVDNVQMAQDTSAPFEVVITGISEGSHTGYARAVNNRGDYAISTYVTFSVGDGSPVSVIDLTNSQALTIHVDGSQSYDPDGNIETFTWDFGDGTTATQVQGTHTYSAPGSYLVTLTVTDNEGNSASSSKTVSVNDVVSSLTCTYAIISEWAAGFSAHITLWNKGSEAISGWEVIWSYGDNTIITNSWNAVFDIKETISATPLGWNQTIGVNQSVSFGFNASKGRPNSPAETVALGGSSCQ